MNQQWSLGSTEVSRRLYVNVEVFILNWLISAVSQALLGFVQGKISLYFHIVF
jgi:hypothetical protein